MNAILKEQTLDNERLSTLSCDVEAIINGRPLTTVSDDPNDECSLTPNHPLLLRGRREVHYSPQVLFKAVIFMESAEGMYNISADQFWKRWLRKYLPTLQFRQKWVQPKRNMECGHIVLIADDNTPRKCWHLGRIIKTFPGKDGRLVRSAQVKTLWTVLTKPVNNLSTRG